MVPPHSRHCQSDESALQMPADWPLDPQAREEARSGGDAESPLAMNCSGKHAGMKSRTTVLNGGDVGAAHAIHDLPEPS